MACSRKAPRRPSFLRDIRRVHRARRNTTALEAGILKQILNEGVSQGIFKIKHVEQTAMVMILSLQGLDVPYIRDNFAELGIERLKLREYLQDFILNGIYNNNNRNNTHD